MTSIFINKLSTTLVTSILLFSSFGFSTLHAEENKRSSNHVYTVGIELSDRFAERNSDGTYTGFEVELWKEIAENLGLKFQLKEFSPFSDLLGALKQGEIDFGIDSITMRHDRAEYSVFTTPYFVTHLSILTDERDINSLVGLLHALIRPILGKLLILIFVIMFIFGNILWVSERGSHAIISKKYFPGIFQAMWCTFAIQSTIGFGDIIPNRWVARLLAVPIWLCGLLLVAVTTAQLLTAFNSDAYRSRIISYKNLRGRTVATMANTTAVDVLDNLGVKKLIPISGNLIDAYPLVEKGLVDAIVFDYPYILNMADLLVKQGKRPFIVPDRFDQQFYSIAVKKELAEADPELVNKINLMVLELKDNGFIDHLKEQWFGDIGLH